LTFEPQQDAVPFANKAHAPNRFAEIFTGVLPPVAPGQVVAVAVQVEVAV
jgi:hypothetical protein